MYSSVKTLFQDNFLSYCFVDLEFLMFWRFLIPWIFFEDLDIFEFSDGLDELENLEFEDDFDDSDDLVVG